MSLHVTGRSRELGRLRYLLDQRQPRAVRVTGLPGVGKSAIARIAMADYTGISFTCPPLPAPAQQAALDKRLEEAPSGGPSSSGFLADGSWAGTFERILRAARSAERPWVLVLDDAHRLSEARARWLEPLAEALGTATRTGVPLHVVLLGDEGGLPTEDELSDMVPPLSPPGSAERRVDTLRIGPLSLRAAADLLPGTTPHARVRAYGVFGGIPRVLSHIDPSVTVGTNVRRLLLGPNGALSDVVLNWIERSVQRPARYMSILNALSAGETDWGTLHAGVPDLTRSGQLAPYLKRLFELGHVAMRSSLDAAPRSRAQRYALADPFLAFWSRFVLPWRLGEAVHLQPPPVRDHYATHVRPGIARHMETVMPRIARQHMRHDALESLGTSVRECGSLWGAEYDIPVAGILSSGAAFYGACAWAVPTPEADPLARLDREIRETRYGFGRERRLRLVFTGGRTPTWLRRMIARRPDAELIDAGALVGA